MVRLLHVLNGLQIGGKERVVLDLAHRATREGYEPALLLFDTPFRSVEVDFDPGELPTHFLPRRPGLDWRFPTELARFARQRQIDILHAHNDTAVFYACVAARLMKRRPPLVVGTFHTWPGHDTRGARMLTKWAARRADRLTAVSDELATRLVQRGWLRNCRVIWTGVNLDRFDPTGPVGSWRQRLGIPETALLVGHVGRLDPIKRQVDLIRTAEHMAPDQAHFVLVGQGPTHAELTDLSQGLDNVHMVPRVADMPAFLRELDVFMLCSDHEAAPKVVLEAMACGRPVVATAVGGVRHILADGGGLLLPVRQTDLMAAAIQELADDPERRLTLGRQARRRAAAFSDEREWCHYAAIYATWAKTPGKVAAH
jgi:glycosyltransferase involved in cell wall biosynthesis